MVYVDEKGAVTWLKDSRYNIGKERESFPVPESRPCGMFVTALRRLVGVNPDRYQIRSFTE